MLYNLSPSTVNFLQSILDKMPATFSSENATIELSRGAYVLDVEYFADTHGINFGANEVEKMVEYIEREVDHYIQREIMADIADSVLRKSRGIGFQEILDSKYLIGGNDFEEQDCNRVGQEWVHEFCEERNSERL